MDAITQTAIIGAISMVSGIVLGFISSEARYKKGKKIFFKMVDTLVAIRDGWVDDKFTDEELGRIITEGAGMAEATKS